jgi:uncharacterized protein (TIGR04552 family)
LSVEFKEIESREQVGRGRPHYGLQDIEQLRLVLKGHSIVDWRQLALRDLEHVNSLLRLQGLDVNRPEDIARLNRVYVQAIDYVRAHFEGRLADGVADLEDVRELFLLASRGGEKRSDACMILKVMHIIHHAAGRELLYRIPIPIAELFYQVERKVYDAVDDMKARGISIVEFAGSRKANHAIITKLLCRVDSQAAQVHDRQRFRIVTDSLNDVLDVLVYMTRYLLSFNYVVPGESRNDLVDFEATMRGDESLRHFQDLLQQIDSAKDGEANRVNTFTDNAYRDINFVVDVPLRLEDSAMADAGIDGESDGRVVFVLAEFQVVDRKTHQRNNQGKSRHALYKARQRERAFARLKPDAV